MQKSKGARNLSNPPTKLNLSPEEKSALLQAEETLRRHIPALFCGLNVAQYRAFKAAYTPDSKTGLIPAIHIVSFANGVGKTTMLVFDMIGWTKGPDYLNSSVFPECAVEYWRKLKNLRDSGQLSLRLVCSADDMKADGSVLACLKEMFPDAQTSKQDNSGVFKQIVVPHPTIHGVTNTIAVHTFDQDASKHAGSTCHRIWPNENLPNNLVGETIARIRSKVGNPAGSIMQCATLLDESTWAQELQDDTEMSIVQSGGHIYENCVGEEVTDEMAAEVLNTIGVQLEKNHAGPGYITNGVLNLSRIKTMIVGWQKTCPEQVEARKCGKAITTMGRIYLHYDPEVHDLFDENFDSIPSNTPVVMVADPHAARPTMIGLAAVDAMDRLIIFDEWPPVDGYGYYETITTRRHTAQEECQIWDEWLKQWLFKREKVKKIGDPNRFAAPNDLNTHETIRDLYAKYGYEFDIDINDDLQYGHEQVSSYLWYDQFRRAQSSIDIAGMPHLSFCKRARNIRRAMQNYAHKKIRRSDAPISENVNPKFSDGAALVRYLVVWHLNHRYSAIAPGHKEIDEYELIKQGRIPPKYRHSQVPSDMESPGRKIVTDW